LSTARARSLPMTVDASYRTLGVRVDAVQIPDVVAHMVEWIERRETGHTIAVTGMHGITEALHDPEFKKIVNSASLVVPDGYPLIVLGRRKGFSLPKRVYGPDLTAAFFERTVGKGYRHFFYGGAPGVAEELARRFRQQFPRVQVAGTHCPPFRALTAEEEQSIARQLRDARPDVVWVGLSTPKQEWWMARFRSLVEVPVFIGVGAAFDFHTGRVPRAPTWLGEHGGEWLFRLAKEPRRLWRRYLLRGPDFLYHVGLELLGLRKFD
jgi:N-acetylglucosaminyldiphosphoundecaprenol N-acetyl-beta-D-mannosaminyltransferase